MSYDLALFNNSGVLSGVNDASITSLVTGTAKVGQVFTTLLMTELGSNALDTECGCDFMTQLNSGAIRTDLDLTSAFNQSASDIVAYLDSLLTGSEPDDEVIVSVDLTNFELVPPYVALYITIWTRAGSSRIISLPITSIEE